MHGKTQNIKFEAPFELLETSLQFKGCFFVSAEIIKNIFEINIKFYV